MSKGFFKLPILPTNTFLIIDFIIIRHYPERKPNQIHDQIRSHMQS